MRWRRFIPSSLMAAICVSGANWVALIVANRYIGLSNMQLLACNLFSGLSGIFFLAFTVVLTELQIVRMTWADNESPALTEIVRAWWAWPKPLSSSVFK